MIHRIEQNMKNKNMICTRLMQLVQLNSLCFGFSQIYFKYSQYHAYHCAKPTMHYYQCFSIMFMHCAYAISIEWKLHTISITGFSIEFTRIVQNENENINKYKRVLRKKSKWFDLILRSDKMFAHLFSIAKTAWLIYISLYRITKTNFNISNDMEFVLYILLKRCLSTHEHNYHYYFWKILFIIFFLFRYYDTRLVHFLYSVQLECSYGELWIIKMFMHWASSVVHMYQIFFLLSQQLH